MTLNLKKYMMKKVTVIMMNNIKYVVFLIQNGTDKVIDTILRKNEKELFDKINEIDFEKLNCMYMAFKEMNALEILEKTIKYI